jgi:NAD(P)H dehydrogenase (quinone)
VTDYVGKLATLHYGAVTARAPRSDDDQAACRKLGQRLAEWVAAFVDGRKDQHPLVKPELRMAPE